MVWKWSYLVKQIVWKILFTHLVTAKCVHGSRAACLTMPLDRRASHSNRHPLIYVCSNQASHPFFVPACLLACPPFVVHMKYKKRARYGVRTRLTAPILQHEQRIEITPDSCMSDTSFHEPVCPKNSPFFYGDMFSSADLLYISVVAKFYMLLKTHGWIIR